MPAAGVVLGRIGRAHGIRGEVRVVSYNAASTVLVAGREVRVGDATYRIATMRSGGGVLVVAFDGVSTREAADALRGQEIAIARDELPAPADDELYLADLVGCECFEGDTALGRVTAITNYPASTCLVIESDAGAREVPAVAPYFVGVDLGGRRIDLADTSDFPVERPRTKSETRKP